MSTDNEVTTLAEILWESLDGGSTDVEKVKAKYRPDATFAELGLDSLDITEFLLRVQDHYKVTVRQGDFNRLQSLAALSQYLGDVKSAA